MTEVLIGARLGIGAILFLSGALKFRHLHRFQVLASSYRLLPKPAADLGTLVLPPLEVVLGALLVVGEVTRLVSVCAAVLFALFACLLAAAIRRGTAVECGCGGVLAASESVGWSAVIRNAFAVCVLVGLTIAPPAAIRTLLSDHSVSRSDLAAIGLGTFLLLILNRLASQAAAVLSLAARASHGLRPREQA